MLKPPKGLMTWDEYGAYMEAAFAEFIKDPIAKEIADKTKRMIGSASPLRHDHPGWGLALQLFRWDRATVARNFPPKNSSK